MDVIMKSVLVAMITLAVGYLFLGTLGSAGPYCPGADPAWLGHCADAPPAQ